MSWEISFTFLEITRVGERVGIRPFVGAGMGWGRVYCLGDLLCCLWEAWEDDLENYDENELSSGSDWSYYPTYSYSYLINPLTQFSDFISFCFYKL